MREKRKKPLYLGTIVRGCRCQPCRALKRLAKRAPNIEEFKTFFRSEMPVVQAKWVDIK
jgi:hypothetical protein